MFRRSVEKGSSGRKTAFLAATATFSLFVIAALVAAWSVFYAPGPSARQGEVTIVTLPSGAGVSAIAANLKAAGVIRSTDMFKAAASLTGADRKLRAGEYEVPSGASLRSVLALLVSGKVVRHYVTIPEGWSSAQAVDILMRQPILTGAVDTVPEEGTLWPDTYEISRGETRAALIGRMQRARDDNLARLWATRGPNSVVRSLDEAVILASIVEKETGVAAERPRVAGVFSNRLRMGMRLESDPTIVYGITKGRPLGRGLRRSEIDQHTDWNTYQIDGLPPTPIANPGRDAIAAVLNPPTTEDIFFVADGTGGHAFARTYPEHLANVARWRAIERRRQGLPPEPAAPVAGAEVPAEGATPGVPPGVNVPAGAQVIRIPQQPAAAQ
ncbi:MAG: endolytic transglycosylase MltG [Brevundimonas sp.]|nr:endolytic transglycosylase MltG [Brevundimonas sp.]